ncbi:MAG: hypothetical protein WCJ71_04080 [Candidatus Omnitrophota bacterium]
MNREGMSFVEVVVSMIILAMVALGVTATITLVNSEGQRHTAGGSIDLQALSLARETLEQLRNAVSAREADGEPGFMLVDANGPAVGVTRYEFIATGTARSNPNLDLPAGDIRTHGGSRFYTVEDIDASSDTEVKDGITDYKKVVVVVDTGTA